MTAIPLSQTKLKCQSRVHGIMKEYPNGQRLLEVRCKDKWCADRNIGEVVFHYFDPQSGRLVKTQKYKDPMGHLRKVTST